LKITKLTELENQLEADARLAQNVTDIDILLPENMVRIVRGNVVMRDGLSGRECRIELWIQDASQKLSVAAVFVCRGYGVFNNYEVALLATKRTRLFWKRIGNNADLAINGNAIVRWKLSWALRLFYAGSGKIWCNDKPFCTIFLPIIGPSSPQMHDCTGRFLLCSCEIVKFKINPAEETVLKKRRRRTLKEILSIMLGGKVPASFEGIDGARSIFYASDINILSRMTEEQRMTVLALAVWPLSLYKGG